MNTYSLFTILLIVAFLGYFSFTSRAFLSAPILENLEVFENKNVLVITGRVRYSNFLSINDRLIYTDNKGKFNELLLLNDGYNVVKILAKNKNGRETERLLKFIK